MSAYLFRPSSAGVWGNCSGSVMASQGRPDISGQDAERGNAAHWVMEVVLLNIRDMRINQRAEEYIGETAPNGVVIDEELAQGAQVLIDDVLETVGPRIDAIHVEESMHIQTVHEHNGGTPDVWAYFPEVNTLYMWDYKNGNGEVLAVENWQGANYLEGVRAKLGLDDLKTRFVFTIVQPYCYHGSNDGPISRWSGNLAEIRPIINRLRQSSAEAFTSPTLTSGRHCRYCPAQIDCSASRKAVYDFFDVVRGPYAMDAMQIDDLVVELDILERGILQAKARLEAVEETLKHRIQAGEVAQGKTVGATYGRNNWTCKPAVAEGIANQFGFSIKNEAVKTPRQATDAAPKEVRDYFAEAIKAVTGRKATGLKLINSDDTIAARAFKRK